MLFSCSFSLHEKLNDVVKISIALLVSKFRVSSAHSLLKVMQQTALSVLIILNFFLLFNQSYIAHRRSSS